MITSHRGFLKNGFYNIYGEIENKGNKNYSNIKLKYIFYDSSGNVLHADEAPISLNILLAGRRSPFAYTLSKKPLASKVKNYTISISSKKVLNEIIPAKLRIIYHRPANDTLLVIVNNLGDSVALGGLFVTVYDANRSVIATNTELLTIDPGARISSIIKIPTEIYNFNLTDVKYYSLTAESINPKYTLENEIVYAVFSEDALYPDPILTMFAIVVSFSAAVLIGAYLIVRYRHGKRRRHSRKSIKRKSQLKVLLRNRERE
jgi:hypothetical protein